MPNIKKPKQAYFKKPEIICFVGKKVGRWNVLSRADYGPGWEIRYNCICDCGFKGIVRKRSLRSGESKSCGCIKAEVTSKRLKDAWLNGFTKNGKITGQNDFKCSD